MSMACGRPQGEGRGQAHVDACGQGVRGSKIQFSRGHHKWMIPSSVSIYPAQIKKTADLRKSSKTSKQSSCSCKTSSDLRPSNQLWLVNICLKESMENIHLLTHSLTHSLT